MLSFETSALDRFERFLEGLHREPRHAESLEAAWLAKGPGTVARLAAALELLGWSGGPASRPPGPIGRDAVEAAVALWRDYFRPHATAAFNRAGPTDLERHARRILRWLKAGNRTEVSGEEVRCGGLGRTEPGRQRDPADLAPWDRETDRSDAHARSFQAPDHRRAR